MAETGVVAGVGGPRATDDHEVDSVDRRFAAVRRAGTATLVTLSVGLFIVSASVLFSGAHAQSNDSFSTGSIDVSVAPSTAVLTAANMVPGAQLTGALSIENGGPAALRYGATSTATDDGLASALNLTVKSGVSVCDDAGWTVDGAVIYSGALGAASPVDLFGLGGRGRRGGSRVLGAGSTEQLCVNVQLPAFSPEWPGRTTSATFTFTALP